jgi:hypothetical protein
LFYEKVNNVCNSKSSLSKLVSSNVCREIG